MARNYPAAASVLALAATLFLAAAVPAQQEERFDERVREFFFSGFAGDPASLRRGMEMVETALASDPDHAQALAWQATGWLFRSGQAFQRDDFSQGMTLFDDSVDQFSRAVSLAPDDVGVLIPRATSFQETARFVAHAPTRTMLLETAVADYLKVLELQKPYFRLLSVHGRGELLGGIADALWQLERPGRAQPHLQRMIAELPGSPYARAAKRQLDRPSEAVRLTCLGCHGY